MDAPAFQKATKKRVLLRLALSGPSGSGKTYTALRVGSRIAEKTGRRMAVIDTEHGSAARYADIFDFDVVPLYQYDPRNYAQLMAMAQNAGGYSVLVIDSISHAWEGTGGILDQVDKAKARASGNSFAGWKDATPEQRHFVEAMLQVKLHLIVTMRSKTEWVMEQNDRGRQVPRRVGMKPVQRDGIEYEFDVAGDIDIDHKLVVTKTRCAELDGAVILKPGEDFADTLLTWAKGTDPNAEPANANGSVEAPYDRRDPRSGASLTVAPPHQQEAAHPTGNPATGRVSVSSPGGVVLDSMETDENARQGYPTPEQEAAGRATAAAPVEHPPAPVDARSDKERAIDAACGEGGWLKSLGDGAEAKRCKELISLALIQLGALESPQQLPGKWTGRIEMAYGYIGDAVATQDDCIGTLGQIVAANATTGGSDA